MLLYVEELQMQKDIRNYDMKGVEFQQERTDRRFLILEVNVNLKFQPRPQVLLFFQTGGPGI